MQQATSALRGPYVRLRLDQFDARAAALGLATDTAIAARIGLDKATVNRVRTGEGLPGERFIAACVANLGVPFEFLFEIAEAKLCRSAGRSTRSGSRARSTARPTGR